MMRDKEMKEAEGAVEDEHEENDDTGFDLTDISHAVISVEKKDFPKSDGLQEGDMVYVCLKGRVSNEEEGKLYVEVKKAGIEGCGESEKTVPDAGEKKKHMTAFILHLSKDGKGLEKIFEVPPYSGKVGAITSK